VSTDLIEVVRENERMRMALMAIRRLAENSAFGGWRFKVAELVDDGLQSANRRPNVPCIKGSQNG
jgi:hypothetical protein